MSAIRHRADLGARRLRTLASVALLALGACGAPDEPKPEALAVPNCAAVSRFGNGQRCDDTPSLAVCGAGTAALCGSGWLCFDAPERAFCACATDADCVGRSAYINTARAKAKIAPLAPKCSGGRCNGAP